MTKEKRIRKMNYWLAIVFFSLSAIVMVAGSFTLLDLTFLFQNGVWTPSIFATYYSVSFLATITGFGFATAIVLFPMVILGFAYYVWHLSDRIKRLERQLIKVEKEKE